MAKRRRGKKLTWPQLWSKLKKCGWMHEPPKGLQTECRFFTPEGWKKRGQGQHLVDYFDGPDEIWQHLPGKVLDDILDEELATNESSDDAPTNKRQAHETRAPGKSARPAPKPAAKACSPARAPTKTPARAPAKAPVRVPAKSPAKSSAKTPSEAVDISTGNDLLSSGDESEFFVDDDEDIDIEANSDVSEDDEESDATSDEEDPTDLSVGTPFDSMSKEELSSHAKTGWTTYLEAESTY
ncbi:hypothetical protein F442_06937 [Phytophthora nicotianae P10297]|uniref:Uncharacterized protein n=1 Tax=Phytophthora nicotianae P10297 TaxID=1317064 RepID=W2ZHX5_PHYNI|nr:hypothetical protein F442_06937 [Phytophthora nicotianae P10297]